jgi:dienelactone hydrolase
MRLRVTLLFLFFPVIPIIAQTYIGEVYYRDSYHYLKIACGDSNCEVSLPYLDGEMKYTVDKNNVLKGDWILKREVANWSFATSVLDNTLLGVLNTGEGLQEIKLWEQQAQLSLVERSKYTGVYSDIKKRKAIVYDRSESLISMSPYSQRTKSLKHTEDHTFWSASGEQWVFSEPTAEGFQKLMITNRFGIKNDLQRIPSFTEEELWIPVGRDTLFAKLFLPHSKEKTPACLVLPGGGAVGMDNYEYEARFFAAYGIVSLIFDKSGNGRSRGSGNFRLQTFEEKNEQYKQLFKFLQDHPRTNPEKVGVHGPSEGGRLALMMAMDLKNIAFVNATAAPVMTMREGQLYAMNNYHRNLGVSESDNYKISAVWNDYYDNIVAGTIDPDVIKRANTFRELYPRAFLPPDLQTVPGAPRSEDITNDRLASEGKNISCPVLLQYGENDERVDPVASIRNFMSSVTDPSKVKVILYNRSNHSFMTPEYEISTGYTDDKIKWLKQIGILEN